MVMHMEVIPNAYGGYAIEMHMDTILGQNHAAGSGRRKLFTFLYKKTDNLTEVLFLPLLFIDTVVLVPFYCSSGKLPSFELIWQCASFFLFCFLQQ